MSFTGNLGVTHGGIFIAYSRGVWMTAKLRVQIRSTRTKIMILGAVLALV
jgi:hypothetical protein